MLQTDLREIVHSQRTTRTRHTIIVGWTVTGGAEGGTDDAAALVGVAAWRAAQTEGVSGALAGDTAGMTTFTCAGGYVGVVVRATFTLAALNNCPDAGFAVDAIGIRDACTAIAAKVAIRTGIVARDLERPKEAGVQTHRGS
jgi:hypothetical protein